MKVESLHPADQLIRTMDRIYRNGMTTTSGGNLSIHDENGDIWITPSGIDKGALKRGDICRVTKDGTIFGPYKPSVELPLHASVYEKRPDIRAILHAHPPALVAFSIARVLPKTQLTVGLYGILGEITMAPYSVPGSQALGEGIAAAFEKGFYAVVLENHGVCIGADTMHSAYMKFETLETTANIEICARMIGTPRSLQESELDLAHACGSTTMDDFSSHEENPEEHETRRSMISMIHRACRQKLFISTQGTYSARVSGDSFIITPHGMDRTCLEENDLVLIKGAMKELGKHPSRSVMLHKAIYDSHPELNSVVSASPPYAMAYAVTNEPFDPRTIPESYIMLRGAGKISFSDVYQKQDEAVDMISDRMPVLICGNDRILAAGDSLLSAFDRLEVAEATARSLVSARQIGEIVRISDTEIEEIDKVFRLT